MKTKRTPEFALSTIRSKLAEKPWEVTPQQNIEIHFDVPNAMVAIRTLTNVARGIQEVSDALFYDILPPDEWPEVYIHPPKEGCFEASFSIITNITYTAILGIAVPTFINAFCKNMFGKDIVEIFQLIGENSSELLKTHPPIQYVSTFISIFLDQRTSHSSLPQEGKYRTQRNKLHAGKNRIFEALTEDTDISGISYDGNHIIDNNDFHNYISTEEVENLVDDDFDYYHGDIQVISPVSMTERSKRSWTGFLLEAPRNHKEETFGIDDDNFIHYALTNGIKPAVDDTIKVQMIKNSAKHPQWRVKRVLFYKGKKISSPLNKKEVQALFDSEDMQGQQQQVSLSDYL